MPSQLEKDSTGSLRGGNLRPEEIVIKKGHNYRDVDSEEVKAHIAWLTTSIMEEGVKNPISVSFAGGTYYLEAGECRLRAAQAARKKGWDGYIPCFQVKGDEAAVLRKNLLDNTGLTPTLLEIGRALQQLLDFGQPMDEVVKCVPPSITTDPAKALRLAKKALDLNAAPLAVKKAVKEGIDGVKITEAAAVAQVRKNPLTAAQNLAEGASKKKAEGKTTLHRDKGAGVATKAKAAEKASVEQLLKLADAVADLALDTTIDRDEVIAAADKYNVARGR